MAGEAPIMDMMPMHDCVAYFVPAFRNLDEIASQCAIKAYIDTRLLLC